MVGYTDTRPGFTSNAQPPCWPRPRQVLRAPAPERRFDGRLPMELYLNAYVDDRLQRGFTTNISETGVYLNTLMHEPLPPYTPVGLEFALPGTRETIWAAGEIRFDTLDDYFLGRGIRFTAMARLHARMLREYCYKLRHGVRFES
jgi:hypothetical protein